jgi:hypothetical protein
VKPFTFEQLAVTAALFVCATLAPLIDAVQLWPLALVFGFVNALLMWGALRDESIAAPVVGMIVLALPSIWVVEGVAYGPLAATALALALGEHLASLRAARYATPGNASAQPFSNQTAVHGGVAALAIALTALAGLLPEARALSLTAVAALGMVAIALHRRRVRITDVALPPPTRLG